MARWRRAQVSAAIARPSGKAARAWTSKPRTRAHSDGESSSERMAPPSVPRRLPLDLGTRGVRSDMRLGYFPVSVQARFAYVERRTSGVSPEAERAGRNGPLDSAWG